MKAQDLKNSILQMAMEGKLVPQDPNDEPASVLLERIMEEKEQLIKEKKIKRDNKESVIFRKNNQFWEKICEGEEICIDDEIPYDIPNSWQWCRLENIVELINGDRGKNYPAKSKLSDISGIPFISAINLKNGEVSEDNLLFLNQQQYNLLRRGKLRKNDLIFCLRGSLGKNAIFNLENGAIASSLVILRKYSEDIFLKYLFTYINSNLLNNEIKKYDNGTAQPNLSAANLKKFFVPMPPLIEQKRIVEKIEELLPFIEYYDKLEKELNKLNDEFPSKIKDSILHEAIQGKLAPQDPDDEPASVLLEKIRAEKERLLEEKLIKKNKKESFIFKENNHFYEKIGKNEPICIDDEIEFDIPNSWKWVRLETVCEYIQRGKSPKYSDIKKYPVVAQKCNQWSGFSLEKAKFIDPNTVDSYKEERILKNKDVLLNSTGLGTLGRVGLYDESVNEFGWAVADSHITVIRPFSRFILQEYIYIYFANPTVQTVIESKAGGSTKQKELNLSTVKNYLIPIPPINEQKRILEKINEIKNISI